MILEREARWLFSDGLSSRTSLGCRVPVRI